MILMSKICGVSTSEILDYIIDHPCSPTLIGFIVNFSKSKRYIKNDKLKKLLTVNKKKMSICGCIGQARQK